MPQQTAETPVDTYRARIVKLQEAMKELMQNSNKGKAKATSAAPASSNGVPATEPTSVG